MHQPLEFVGFKPLPEGMMLFVPMGITFILWTLEILETIVSACI